MNITISEMYCTECGNKGIDIPRKRGREKEAGHLKSLYCLNCKKKTNHVEIRPFGSYNKNDFLIEFENGNFKNGIRVNPSYKSFISSFYNEQRKIEKEKEE